MLMVEVPLVQRKIKYLQLDTVTWLGFLASAFVGEEGGWPFVGGAPDDIVTIFTMVNSPLKADKQTIQFVRNAMRYQLLGVGVGAGRENSDPL